MFTHFKIFDLSFSTWFQGFSKLTGLMTNNCFIALCSVLNAVHNDVLILFLALSVDFVQRQQMVANSWRTKLWFPENYIVVKKTAFKNPRLPVKEVIIETKFNENEVLSHDQIFDLNKKHIYKSEPVSTLSSDVTTSLYDFDKDKKLSVTYGVEKNIIRTSSTKYPFWRWLNIGHRLWSWTWNAMFLFLLYIPFRSRFGIKALAWPTVFYPGIIVHPHTGVLHPKKSSKTHSFVSRFRALWRHVHKSRVRFEISSDTGFLSKTITRHFNRFWNYVVKGIFGSILLVLCNPIICIFTTAGSFTLGITAPLWTPFVVLGHYLFCIFIFDRDAAYKHLWGRKNRIALFFDMIIYRFLILGVCQTFAALCSAFIILPFCSATIFVFGYIRFGLRSAWDSLMFNIVIKRHGRIPQSDSFVARRISGPGLSRNYVYQISVEQAIVATEHRIQSKELDYFEKQILHWIEMPYNEFKRFMTSLQKYSGLDGFNCMSRSVLNKQKSKLVENLHTLINPRRKELTNAGSSHVLGMVRMEAADLERTLKNVAQLLQTHYPGRIFPHLVEISVEAWWDKRTLAVGDWLGLAEQFCSKLFSPEFLVPLDDSQEHFKLEVQHVNLSQYMNMLISGDHREDLDQATPVFRSKVKKPITLRQPEMPLKEFKPFVYTESCGLYLVKGHEQRYFSLPPITEAIPIIAKDVD